MNAIQIRKQKITYKSACHLMCYQCMGADIKNEEYEKGTQNLIKQCVSKNCPLYSLRPYK